MTAVKSYFALLWHLASFIVMLNSCACCAQGQGDGCDFNPSCSWEFTEHVLSQDVVPQLQCHARSKGQFTLHHRVTPSWPGNGSSMNVRCQELSRCNALWEESEIGHTGSSGPGFKLDMAAIRSLGHVG